MTKPPLTDAPVRTAAELTRRWQAVLEPPIFGARSLWLTWLDDGHQLPVVIPVDDIPPRPARPMLTNLATVCASVSDEHVVGSSHLAMALCRPGQPEVTADDVAWAEGLRAALAAFDGTWSLHLAAGGSVVPMIDMPPSP